MLSTFTEHRSALNVWALAPLLITSLLHSLWLIFHWGGEPLREWVGDIGYTIPLFLAAQVCWLAANHHQGAARRSWRWLAFGVLSFGLGSVVWTVYELILNIAPYPSPADAFYLAFPIFIVFAFLSFPRPALSRLQAFQLALDVLITVMAVAVFLWPFLLAPAIEAYGEVSLAMLISLAYPLLDLVMLGLLLSIVLRRSEQALGPDEGLLALGLIVMVVADLIYNSLSANGMYQTGNPIDGLWVWGSTLFALAAYTSLSPRPALAPGRYFARLRLFALSSYIPYLAVLACYGMSLLTRHREGLTELGVSIGVGLVTLFVLSRQALAFIENQRLTKALQAFSSELEQRVEERSRELERSQARLMASEKLASLGQLTAGLAHEINTPLAAARNYLLSAKTLAEEYRASIGVAEVSEADHRAIAAELSTSLKDADGSLERLGEFVRRMRSHTRASGGSIDFDPYKVTSDTLPLLEHRARKANIRLHSEPALEAILIHGDPSRFGQVVSNLIVNAMDACEESGRADKQVNVRFAKQDGKVVMSVQDNGSGIPDEVLPKIFEPMFTTKDVGKGTGLGLSIVHGIVTGQFAGTIDMHSVVGQGTTFSLAFPAVKVAGSSPELKLQHQQQTTMTARG